MDSINNFAISQLAGGITATQLTATVATGQGSRFPSSGAFNVVIYDASYSNAALAYQAGKAAIYRVLSRTGDILTFKDNGSSQREGQEGTTAIAHNTLGATYVIMQALTAKLLTDLAVVTGSTGWINVKDNGAVGDGSADDTSAIAAAIALIPATGGVLYFPSGHYKITSTLTIPYPTLILGCGMGNFPSEPSYGCLGVSTIDQSVNNTTAFIVTAKYAKFENLAIISSSITASTSGAGIQTSGSSIHQKVDYESVSVDGFWINIDVQVGAQWSANNIFITNPQKYGLKVRNTVNNDAGDWSICNANFNAYAYSADAAIRIESSGGARIDNTKINCGYINPVTPTAQFGYGIDLDNSSANASTMILHIQNTSIENFTKDGVHVNVGSYFYHHLYLIGVGIGVPGGNTGYYAINLISDSTTNLKNVVINGCIFYGKTTGYAINLQNIDNVMVGDNIIETGCFSDGLVTQSGCTNIVIDTGSSSSGVSSSGFDGFTKLLLPMNSAEGFLDETGKTVSVVGSAAISTAQQKFDGSCGAFLADGAYLTVPDFPELNLGTRDFTIDFWVRFNSLGMTYVGLMDHYTDGSNKWSLMMGTSSGIIVFNNSTGGAQTINAAFSWVPSLNTWYHVAFVRQGISNWYCFVNGSPLSVFGIVGATESVAIHVGALSIARVDNTNAEKLDGWLDELRISVGKARWTSAFTPPTQPY